MAKPIFTDQTMSVIFFAIGRPLRDGSSEAEGFVEKVATRRKPSRRLFMRPSFLRSVVQAAFSFVFPIDLFLFDCLGVCEHSYSSF